jgi:hypothetical protein
MAPRFLTFSPGPGPDSTAALSDQTLPVSYPAGLNQPDAFVVVKQNGEYAPQDFGRWKPEPQGISFEFFANRHFISQPFWFLI